MMKSSEIRQSFIDYFGNQDHEVVPASSLIPFNDPTLLFTNAGMVQFKDTFLGVEKRSYCRAVTAQPCLRAGGKHNDLENVGYTARHHTFFEMLGNFSFGDYFKREAITFAWEFLTQVLKLPPTRLWVTVYQNDDEAADIWLNEIGVSAERFSRCGEEDNFWSMGDTGPCGPCTEIFYDHGPEIAGGPPGTPEADGDRYVEIWNLVFMQFNRDKQGVLNPLPKPSVDTGMGLERITAVVQGVHSNYDIDSFQYLIAVIASMTKGIDKKHPSLKVIADHIRACVFLISDGIIPSNEGRGYVLRRIIRRAIRHGNQLKLTTPFFCDLVKPLIRIMDDAYPQLVLKQEEIEKILLQEEQQFSRTLEQGLKLLQTTIQNLESSVIPGDVAFKLYDTYGFPVDLTADIAREQQLTVDMAEFDRHMKMQREQSQSASTFAVDYTSSAQWDLTSTFQGYQHDILESSILAMRREDKTVKKISKGEQGVIVLEETPFYAESGGQVGDCGFLKATTGIFRVDDTQKIGSTIIHYGEVIEGTLQQQDKVKAEVDVARRDNIRLNHTATHLLHAALKQIVGPHVQQKGSLVEDKRARFDFTHGEALSAETIQKLEILVNEKIRTNDEVITTIMPLEAAQKSGAVALFGEKYGDEVRVLSLGNFSKELCGGTHAKRTGDIGLFKIIAEYGIASGVRRIELVTGHYALKWVQEQNALLTQLAADLKTNPPQLTEKVAQLIQETKQLEKNLMRLRQEQVTQSSKALLGEVQVVEGVNLLIKQMSDIDGQDLRGLLDQLKSSLDNAVIVLISLSQARMQVVVGVSKNLIGKVPAAGEWVRYLCGKGGGREDMAQGGGVIPEDLQTKIAHIATMLKAR